MSKAIPTFAHWEGYTTAQTRKPCRFTDPAEQAQWAAGFSQAVSEGRAGKVWYKSNTMRVALILGAVGVLMFAAGQYSGGTTGNVVMAAGGGMSLSNLLSMFLRATITSSPVVLRNGSLPAPILPYQG